MPGDNIKLVGSETIAEGTMAFHFTRPSGFDFRAGQAIDITLIHPSETDPEGNTRAFSIASPPFEDGLTVATRMRDSAFKRVLRNAQPGIEVRVEGPSGSLTLHKNAAKPAVFLAGGIGITPFVSIVRQAMKDKPNHQLYLFYSNRRPEDAPFLDILRSVAQEHPKFHFVATMTKMEASSRTWTGETGMVDAGMVFRHVPDPVGPIYYIAGPPAMVVAMRQMLLAAKVDEDDVRTEEFPGY
ncbi:MAG: FAD-dependent oxidoreductase [Terriglobia bacterium]|nr:FAD-dependent oxidoreductase [Terriglobia bacterium]